jgi:hypothetical protein
MIVHVMLRNLLEIHPTGRADAWKTDRMRTDPIVLHQMDRVGNESEYFEFPVGKPEEGTDSDIIATRFDGTGGGVEPP